MWSPTAGECFTFQQDNAPAHPSSTDGAVFISKHTRFHLTIDVAAQLHRSQSSRLWSLGVLQRRLYRTRIRDVDRLKQRLVEEWRHFSQDIIDWAVRQWSARLRACVREKAAILSTSCNRWRPDCRACLFNCFSTVSNGRSRFTWWKLTFLSSSF